MFAKWILLMTVLHKVAKSEDVEDILLSKAIVALNKLLDFVMDNYVYMDIDGISGITSTEAHLVKAMERTQNTSIIKQLTALVDKAQLIHTLQKPNLPTTSYIKSVYVIWLIPPQVWMLDIPFTHGKLNPNPKVYTGKYNISDGFGYFSYIMSSTFNVDATSDICFVLILTGPNETQPHFCPISQTCDYLLKMPTEYTEEFPGYGATHMYGQNLGWEEPKGSNLKADPRRVIMLQFAKLKNCTFSFSIEERIVELCSYILWEMRKNVEYGYISNFEDLVYEQIYQCGLEGYAEFLKREYLEYLLQNQEAHGGFGVKKLKPYEVFRRFRSKRSSVSMKYGTNSHTTSLAADVLAVFITLLLGNPFEGKAFLPE